MNKVILIGRLTRDPELRYTSNGIPMASFTLAVERPYTNQNGEKNTDFIDIKAWRKLAEVCANNLEKGRLIAIDGRLEQQKWETNDGQKRSRLVVVSDSIKFLDYSKSNNNSKINNSLPADDPFGSFDLSEDDVPF